MEADEDFRVCAICLENTIDEKNSAAVPGCGHRFHVACLLNCAQYDVRCPTCRGVGEGVLPKTSPSTAVVSTSSVVVRFGDDGSEYLQRVWRRYTARRRRVLRQRPDLAERMQQLRSIRSHMNEVYTETQKLYDRRCREVWSHDPEVTFQRQTLQRMRRRERRLERILETQLEGLLGPEPF